MTRLPPASALLAFEAVARLQSIKLAAEELHLTSSAVSRQVQGLEARLGVELFVRAHRKIALSSAGTAYLAEVGPPLQALRLASRRMHEATQTQPVSIVTYPAFGARWLLPRWTRFIAEHPDIDVSLGRCLTTDDFVRTKANLAICAPKHEMLVAHNTHWKLVEIYLTPVAHPSIAARLKTLDDLASETLLHSSLRPIDWELWLAAAGRPGFEAKRNLNFDDTLVALKAAAAGAGVGIAFRELVEEELASGQLVEPFPDMRAECDSLSLFQCATELEAPNIGIVRDWLLSEASTADA
ncbi:MAG: LysR family transcriptional regulator [Alphaproteobacteria bacterium]|nr:LysR family transcriptional regulator [Alphaproteobacteria bacterium]MCB9928682.1 LysR family transcriptional regulator [Alphaproteobacteria bacterium]